jgi:chemotaxis signal transduction protein
MSRDEDLLHCEAGAESYAFRSRDVRHIERAEHLRPAANGDGRSGVLMLGGQAVPVFSLTAALGSASGHQRGNGHIAVTAAGDGLIGWLVDRIARLDRSAVRDVAPLPPFVGPPANRWFEGAVRIDGQRTALLLRPQFLNSTAPASEAAVNLAPPESVVALDAAAEPVAVVFMTGALPAAPAQRFALSGRQVAAIVQADPVIAVPGSADHVQGVVWWRRSIVPVIDFARAADRDADAPRRRLIARAGARQPGALVALSIEADVVMCRADGSHREIHELPRPWFAAGIFDINGEAVALLDLDVLLEPRRSQARDGDAVLPDLLVERAARDAEPLGGALDPSAFGP